MIHKSIATKAVLLATITAVSVPAFAQFTYSGADTIADFRVGHRRDSNGNMNPWFVDHHESFLTTNPHVTATGNYTGTNDNGIPMTYNGTGIGDTHTSFLSGGVGATFIIDAQTSLISGNGLGTYSPFTSGFASTQALFTSSTSGTFTLVAGGAVTNVNNNGFFIFRGNFQDFTSGTNLNFVVANNSSTLTPFSQDVSIVAGHSYSLYYEATAMSIVPGQGGPASAGATMNGYVALGTVPEPASLAVFGIGSILLARRRRK